MMIPFPCPRSMRLALARMDATVVPGVSSMSIGRALTDATMFSARVRSLSLISPSLMAPMVKPLEAPADALASMRCPISVAVISSEKRHTFVPTLAIDVARLIAKALLPTAGRAPRTMSCPGSNEPISSSSLENPVLTWSVAPPVLVASAESRTRRKALSMLL